MGNFFSKIFDSLLSWRTAIFAGVGLGLAMLFPDIGISALAGAGIGAGASVVMGMFTPSAPETPQSDAADKASGEKPMGERVMGQLKDQAMTAVSGLPAEAIKKLKDPPGRG